MTPISMYPLAGYNNISKEEVVPEFCYHKLAQKLCMGVYVDGAWVEVESKQNKNMFTR